MIEFKPVFEFVNEYVHQYQAKKNNFLACLSNARENVINRAVSNLTTYAHSQIKDAIENTSLTSVVIAHDGWYSDSVSKYMTFEYFSQLLLDAANQVVDALTKAGYKAKATLGPIEKTRSVYIEIQFPKIELEEYKDLTVHEQGLISEEVLQACLQKTSIIIDSDTIVYKHIVD